MKCPDKCPECGAPRERLFRYDLPGRQGQKWLCFSCESIWIHDGQKKAA